MDNGDDIHEKTYFMGLVGMGVHRSVQVKKNVLVKKDGKKHVFHVYQVTIPNDLAQAMDLKKGDLIEFSLLPDGLKLVPIHIVGRSI